MPLVTDEPIKPFEGAATAPHEQTTVLDQLDAAFTRENSVGAAFASRGALPSERTGRGAYDFQLESVLTDPEKAYRQSFATARSEEDVAEIRKRIDGERKTRQALSDGPLPEWLANTAAGIFDPVSWFPAVGPMTRGAMGARAIGGSVLLSTGIDEFALSNRQYERTTSESVANVIMSATIGGALGFMFSPKGAVHTPIAAPKEVTQDLGALIRSSGLTGPPRPRADLLSTTAVARFMDRSPTYFDTPNVKVDLPDADLLNAITLENPAALNRVNNASDNLAKAQGLHAQMEPRNRIDQINKLNGEKFTVEYTIRDAKRLNEIEHSQFVDPREVALLAEEKATILARNPGLEQARALQLRQLEDRLRQINERKAFYNDANAAKIIEELELARREHENAKIALGKKVTDLRAMLDSIADKIGPTGKAAAAADVLSHREALAAHLDSGLPLNKFKQIDPNKWIKGLVNDPRVTKVEPEKVEGFVPKADTKTEAKSLSAASVHGLDKRMSQLAGSYKVADLMAKLKKVGLAAPSLELGTSIFDTARRVVHQIVDTGMITLGNTRGLANPLNMATEIKLTAEADIYAIDKIVQAGWKDYTKSPDRALSKSDFMKQVAYAMRRADKSDIPEVAALAAELRKFDNKYKDLAKEWKVGVFKDAEKAEKGVGKTAPSHFYRAYDVASMRSRYADFIEMASEYFAKRGIEDRKMKFKNGQLVDKEGKPVSIEDDPREFASEAAQSVFNKIMSFPDGRLPPEIKVSEGRGSAKERTFNIPDNFVSSKGTKFEDFLDNNPINVMSRYVKTLGADVAYQKTIGGDEGFKEIMDALRTEATDLAKEAKSPKDSERILKQYEHEAELVQRLVEQVRGTNGRPQDARYDGFNRVLKSARAFNVVRSLGSVIFSQLPDAGTLIMSEGMNRVFGNVIKDAVTGFSGIKLGVAEGRKMGTATDMSLMGRSGALLDLGERYRNVSKAETLLDTAAHYSMIGFGIAPWTTAIKGLASHLGGDSILRGVRALATGGDISDKLRAQLARDGIGVEEAKRIFAESDTWVKHNGLLISNAQSWKDETAKNLFASALVRRVDNAVITPNAGDAPLWTSTEIGKTLFQFKRFAWASNQRTLIAGLQGADVEALNGMLAMMGLALLGTVGRDYSSKGQLDPNRTTAGWAREMVDRSGIVSQFMEGDALLDKATGGHGLARTLTGEQAQRFSSTGLLERAGGPTVGLLSDVSKAMSGFADGTASGSDIHNLRRLAPAQNFPATRWLFDQMENNIVNDLGLVPRQIK
jgi:hypothetical protein